MTNEETGAVAPSLSTYQDQDTFEFDKYTHESNSRKHLSLDPIEDEKQYREIITNYYSIDETAEYIKAHPEWKRITLQFPDELVCDSSAVSQYLGAKLGLVSNVVTNTGDSCGNSCGNSCGDSCGDNSCGDNSCGDSNNACCSSHKSQPHDSNEPQSLWILADTSYSPCCVDEVAAEHVKGDMVIHYGDACLNPVNKLPVAYVFGRPTISFDEVISQFRTRYDDTQSKIVLMCDAPYSYILQLVYDKLVAEYPNIVFSDILQESFPQCQIIGYSPTDSSKSFQSLNRSFQGISNDSDEDSEQILTDYDLFHIGVPEAPRLLKLTTMFQSVTLWNPNDNKISQGPFPNLMRRYRYMQIARSSGTIGLLVNTLSLANAKVLLNRLKSKITEAGKKHYMFVVGKPNVAKLANFELIDVWCILGCDHQGIIIDQNNEYFKPIITPFELLLSLNPEVVWTGKWETDFNRLIEEMNGEEEENDDGNGQSSVGADDDAGDNDDNNDDDEPQFDPVTGTFTSTSKPLRRPQYLEISSVPEPEPEQNNTNSDALVKKFSSAVTVKDTVSTAAVRLQNRHWTGLGSDYQDDEDSKEGALVEEGTKGIARGYEFDVNNNK